MSTEYVMPKLAMAMNEGTIAEWLIESGQRVDRGQLLATVETEKVAYDLESPQAGFLKITVPNGETVRVESPIGIFYESEEELAAHDSQQALEAQIPDGAREASDGAQDTHSPQSAVPASRLRTKASPLARKLAKNHDLDLRSIDGTGPGGRIVKRDILAALAEPAMTAESPKSMQVPTPAIATEIREARELARVPMSGMRGAIAKQMRASLQSTAQLSLNWDSDITDLMSLREKFVARATSLGTKVSMNAFIAKAISSAIRSVPIVNSCTHNEQVVVYRDINMGFAVSLPGSTEWDSALVVAVIRDIGSMGVVEIDMAMKSIVKRVRAGEASHEDLSGSTITLSSTAFIGPPGLVTTPILNTPNSTLIGTSTPIRQAREVNGELVARTVMPVSLTFDHCAYDGELAARFANAFHECLESPELMLA
ncbi:MAG: acetoin dehydrogenase complex dihydrolipoyllysine-residue acetyltransferase [Congregibacter sp.]